MTSPTLSLMYWKVVGLAEGRHSFLRGAAAVAGLVGLVTLVAMLTAARTVPMEEAEEEGEAPVPIETPWMTVPGTMVAEAGVMTPATQVSRIIRKER